MAWLRELIDWQSETGDSGRLPRLAALRHEQRRRLRLHAARRRHPSAGQGTPIDFAYAVHTEVGHACIGARVNGRLVSLESELQTGDVVEIFTSKSPDAGPSRDWLDIVKSPRARNKIRQWFTKERREEAIDHGRDILAKQMRKENLPLHRLFKHDTLDARREGSPPRRRVRAVRGRR